MTINIPLPPEISESQIDECRKNNDYCPIMFEWFKYVGEIANYFSNIQLASPAIKDIPKIHHSVLIGLLNRCSRLILSNVVLSHEGLFGETTSIIDRSIFESAVKLSWLCKKGTEDSFNRLIAEGLKTEVEFKKKINRNIEIRDGKKLPVEERMLTSIQNYFNKSGLTEEEISNSKRLPNLAQMIQDIGHDRLSYIVGQKIGSHHIHGTWVSLWFHYLEEKDGIIKPRDHNCETHINQYVYVSLAVLGAIIDYIHYICISENDSVALSDAPQAVSEEIKELFLEVKGSDYAVV